MTRSIPALVILLGSLVAAPLPWLDDTRALRSVVTLPPTSRLLEKALVSVRDDLGSDPAVLGLSSALVPASLKILEIDPTTGKVLGAPGGIPYTREGGLIFWQATTGLSSGKTFSFYYNVATHPRTGEKWSGATLETPTVFAQAPDYAQEKLGHAWDFDDGEFAGIYAWGDTPQAIQNKKVEGGVLSFDAVGDAWFTWGSMFTGSPWISLDPATYNLLLIRMRQNVSSAPWQLFCLDGGKQIRRHDFTVAGKGWQVLRFDLAGELRWKGPLKSLRIDPTDKLKSPAHIEIDWVRVVSCLPALRAGVESRFGESVADGLRLEAPESAVAGTAFEVKASLTGSTGKPVGWGDVTLRLVSSDGKVAGLLRALTRADGVAFFAVSNTRAGRYTLSASGTLAPKAAAEKAVALVPGAPAAIALDPGSKGNWYPAGGKWMLCAREGEAVRLTVRLEDALGNLVPLSGVALWEGLDKASVMEGGNAFAEGRHQLTFTAKRTANLQVEKDGVRSAPICLQVFPKAGKRDGIRLLPNGYYGFADGKVFYPLGGHYANWPAKGPDFKATFDFFPCNISAFKVPVPFDEPSISLLRAWFSRLKADKVNVLRLMLRNMDLCGSLDKAQMAAVREYMALAHEYGIYFVVVLMEDYNKPPYVNRKMLEQIILPNFPGIDLSTRPAHQARFLVKREEVEDRYTDPDAMKCQKDYLAEVIPWLADIPNVFVYELENEMVHAPASWIDEMTRAVKAIDGATPVVASTGGGGLDSGDPYWFTARTAIDAYTYHQYPRGALKGREDSKVHCPALLDDDLEFGNIISTLTRYGRACPKPCFFGESGWFDNYFKTGEIPAYLQRDIVWLSIVHNPGHLFWLHQGEETAVYRQVPAILERLDLATFRRDPGERVVDASHDPGTDYHYYQTNKMDFWRLLMQNRKSLDSGALLDFTLEKKAGALQLADLEAPIAGRRALAVSKGYQVDAMGGNRGERWLIYLRNYAGVEVKPNKPNSGGYARTRSACDLVLSLDLPGKKYRRTLVDLNEGTTTEVAVAGKHTLSVRNTDHDYVVVLRGN